MKELITSRRGNERRSSRVRVFAVVAIVVMALVVGTGAVFLSCAVRMPGTSYSGPVEEGTVVAPTEEDRALADRLRGHVEAIAQGERCIGTSYEALERSAVYVEERLAQFGYQVNRQEYQVDGVTVRNIEAVLEGGARSSEVVVVGAHYDSAEGTPAANDNGSGVASLLELARSMWEAKLDRTVRFVAFVNEEPPYFQTQNMGSYVYARECKQRGDDIAAMLALETMGYFSDEPGSQNYPPLISHLYPSTGNFIGFVGDTGSRDLVRRCVGTFRESARFPSEGAAFPGEIPGIGWSDHWSFWQMGYPGVMVTDTATYRYPHYHEPTDTPDKIDYQSLAIVTIGIESVIRDLARAE